MDASVEFVKQLLPTIVNIHATVPRGHTSTRILGEERMGSGVVVEGGLILTVNYVVMGANVVEVAPIKGRRTRAEVVAQDYEVGLAVLGRSVGVAGGPSARPRRSSAATP